MTASQLDGPIVFQKTTESDILVKKYEEMSFEEMSQHMQESNRQMSELLTTSMSSSHSASTLDSVTTTAAATISEEEKETNDPYKKYTRLFTRAASNGDLVKVKEMLLDKTIREFIDINARDRDGTPPLIYAACFGKTEIAQVLIEHGASLDTQDNCKYLCCSTRMITR